MEGGEGNSVGWMGEGEEGGKKTTGWMGETGEEGWDAGCLVGEEGERGAGLRGGDEGAAQVRRTEVGSMDKQGAAGREVGEVSISGGEEIGKEATGGVSAEGEGES